MVRIALLLGILIVAMTSPPTSDGPAPGKPVTVDTLPKIVYIAHRGGALEVPENSMSGLRHTFDRHIVDVIDFDTRMLRDGTLVVFHDATLDRTTNMTGPVRALDRHQWQAVRLLPSRRLPGHWKPERPATVRQVLDRFGGKTVLMLEAKDPASLPKLAAMIRSRGLTRSVFVNTKRPWLARKAHRMGLLAQLWRSRRMLRHDQPRQWRGFVSLLDVDHRARPIDLRRCLASGIPRVWAHTVDTERTRDRMLRMGFTGIITDAPARLTATAVGRN